MPVQPLPDFERCERAVREQPRRNESYRCFWEVARARKAWDEAARRLEAHLAREPSNWSAKLTLAWVEWDRGGAGVERLFAEAADGFAAEHNATGEVFARLGLAWFLRQRGRAADARPVVERALVAARASDDPLLVARVRIDQGEQAYARSDFGEALAYLGEAEEIATEKRAKDVLAIVIGNQAYGWWELGLYRQSMEAYERQASLYHEMGAQGGAAFEESRARANIAELAGSLHTEGQLERSEVVRLAREAVASAVVSGNRVIEANARLFLTQWLAGSDAKAEIERALALARATGDRRTVRFGLRLLARQQVIADPARPAQAYRTIAEELEDARLSGDREDLARGLVMRASMRFRTGPRPEWRADSAASLDAIERIRDLQPDTTVRALAFGPWAFAYYRFSGCLLGALGTSEDPRGDLDLAFEVIERMRARVLLDCLDRAGARPELDESSSAVRRRGEVMRRVSELQARLVSPALKDDERRSAVAELERLQVEEASLREAIARVSPAFARARPTSFAGVADVQARLEPDQALVSFQLAPSTPDAEDPSIDGGSWTVLVTRRGAHAFPLPARHAIEDAVAVYLGLCRRRDGSEARAAARLYRGLLEAALHEAGPEVRRLVIVPDGCLNRLPFGSLREGADQGAPLALRLEIAEVPSATLWLRWKTAGDGVQRVPRALTLADPDTAGLASGAARLTNPWLARLDVGRLPYARTEALALARGIGSTSVVLTGADASEAAVKRADLRGYGALHFAAHAVVDDAHPDRSAIVLAPGSSGEDGLLQLGEIVRLRLDRQVVVLSSCRSASGTEVEGEGVLGLARGFFQAGAAAVVGTVWPVRDDDMEAFMAAFARELGRGQSLSGAHREAARAALRAGLPAAAWAGTVVLGDGDLVPVPGGRPARRVPLPLAAGALLALLWLLVRHRPRRSRTAT